MAGIVTQNGGIVTSSDGIAVGSTCPPPCCGTPVPIPGYPPRPNTPTCPPNGFVWFDGVTPDPNGHWSPWDSTLGYGVLNYWDSNLSAMLQACPWGLGNMENQFTASGVGSPYDMQGAITAYKNSSGTYVQPTALDCVTAADLTNNDWQAGQGSGVQANLVNYPAGSITLVLYGGLANNGADLEADKVKTFLLFMGTVSIPAGWTYDSYLDGTTNAAGESAPILEIANTIASQTVYSDTAIGGTGTTAAMGLGSGGKAYLIPNLVTAPQSPVPTAVSIGSNTLSAAVEYGKSTECYTYQAAPSPATDWNGSMGAYGNPAPGACTVTYQSNGSYNAYGSVAAGGGSLNTPNGLGGQQFVANLLTISSQPNAYYYLAGTSVTGVYTAIHAGMEPQTITVN